MRVRRFLFALPLVAVVTVAATTRRQTTVVAPEIDPHRRDRGAVLLATLDLLVPPDNLPRVEDCERFWTMRSGGERDWNGGLNAFALQKVCANGTVVDQRTGMFEMSSDPPFHIHFLGINESPPAREAAHAFQQWRDALGQDPKVDEVVKRWPDQKFGPTSETKVRARIKELLPGVEMAAGNKLKLVDLTVDDRDQRTYGWIVDFAPASRRGIACTATIEAFEGELSDVRCDVF
jgi:hypothetical protein